jgi:kumamolisin
MKRSTFVIAAVLFVSCVISASAQRTHAFRAITPRSSIAGPTDAGQVAHTNIEILSEAFSGAPQTVVGPPFPGLFFETPASLACIYNLVGPSAYSPQCNPNAPLTNAGGGSKAVAVVDAYDAPNAGTDLQAFSTQFGLPAITPASFAVVYAPHGTFPPGSCTGPATQPGTDPTGGWELEESLAIEYVHGMAPGAKLYLVEAQSNSLLDLFCAVSVAGNLVASAGGGEVAMTFGSAEFPAETLFDPILTTPGVVYFASAGDSPGASYPAASPNVVAVGGTTLSRNPVSGSFLNENVWQSGGSGPSAFEALPGYQTSVPILKVRGTPDVAADANPNSGVFVLDDFNGTETPCPSGPCWYIIGGTSLASPLWAGIVNASNTFAGSTNAEQIQLYESNSTYFNDITLGSCGMYMGYFATPGWDYCSGNGSPNGYMRSR